MLQLLQYMGKCYGLKQKDKRLVLLHISATVKEVFQVLQVSLSHQLHAFLPAQCFVLTSAPVLKYICRQTNS